MESGERHITSWESTRVSIKTLQVITDDYDGTELKPGQGQTVSFAFEGHPYEIDLSDKNYKKFHGEMQVWISNARRPGGSAPRTRGRTRNTTTKTASAAAGKTDNQAIRAWARENSLAVSERGRISSEIQAAYAAAH